MVRNSAARDRAISPTASASFSKAKSLSERARSAASSAVLEALCKVMGALVRKVGWGIRILRGGAPVAGAAMQLQEQAHVG